MPLPLITPTASVTSALPKLLGAAFTAIAAFVISAPPVLHTTAGAAFWLFVTDYFTGIAAAALRPNDAVNSSTMRLKMKSKLICYAQIISLGGAVAVMAQSWLWFVAAWGSVAASEGWSIVENIRSSATAPEMAPIRAFLDRLTGFFTTSTAQVPGGVPVMSAAPEVPAESSKPEEPDSEVSHE